MPAVLLDALFATAHDLVVGAAIVSILFGAGCLFAGVYRGWERQQQRARREPAVDEPSAFSEALKVIGGSRRDTAPERHLGKVRLPGA